MAEEVERRPIVCPFVSPWEETELFGNNTLIAPV